MKLFGPVTRAATLGRIHWPWLLGICFLFGYEAVFGATRSPKMPVVPKWERFETAFRSSLDYDNPLQQVRLRVVFTSPLGETNQVDAFWDGGNIWRVRYSPNQPGRWNYVTICSDAANHGLDDQTGHFLCTSPLGKSRFLQHGLVQVAHAERYLEHADHTPFFWLADTVWNGAAVSTAKDWELYAYVRASQDFSVAQWAVVPGADERNESALTGFPERIGINPEFFKRLDAKLQILSSAGILSAIAPLLELGSATNATALPTDQAILLARYVVARWGADPVAWLVVVDGDEKQAERWKRIGNQVFAATDHAPVVLSAATDALDKFRDQAWVDVVSFPSGIVNDQEGMKQAFAGPSTNRWSNPPRPILHSTPYENALIGKSHKRVSSDDVRRAAYSSGLSAPIAGLTYGGQGVLDWDATTGPKADLSLGASLPLWHKALFMPAAKQLGMLARLMQSISFWQLRPDPQADVDESRTHFLAATNPQKSLALVYVPRDRTVSISVDSLPAPPTVMWFNPRNGESSPAVAVLSGHICQFPTPGPGDWLLFARKGR